MTITLYHGDCLVEMSKIPDGSVDMILCDLPYGTTACKWDNVIPFEPLWAHYWRVLKPNGAVVLFGSEPFSSHLRMSQIKHYKYDWVWVKNTSTGVSSFRYMPMKNYENIVVFCRQKTRFNPQMTKRFSQESENRYKYKVQSGKSNHQSCGSELPPRQYTPDLVNPRMVINFKTEPNAKGKFHPTQKSVALLEYLIRTYTLEGETVLDNTMGSGSTGVACVNTGRKFIGIEMDDKYFAIAKERIEKAQEAHERSKETLF
jgi:DNA modification methylase